MREMQSSSDNQGTKTQTAAISSPAVKPPEPVTIYHWLVFLLAAAGWMFDCMGQRVFVLAREPALRELLGATTSPVR